MRQDNAKLGDMLAMAAAVDLLEVVQLYVVSHSSQQCTAGSTLDLARRALAKATGAAA